jgi:hypothetical protein
MEITAKESNAYNVLILNITQTEIKKPINEMYHLERKEGRYEGEAPK